MRPVYQTIVCAKRGNCWAACVASILEMSLDQVPNFVESDEPWFEFGQWLHSRGLKAKFHWMKDGDPAIAGFCILVGESHSFPGEKHAVVGLSGDGVRTVHDPNPSAKGLASEPFLAIFILPCNPDS